jgi:tRNA nucleotidyltransferase (CCA-adding enzyme)
MSTSSRLSKFLANLTITSDQRADAQTKSDGVAGKLHSHYYGTTFTGSTRKLIGSYGKGTAVRPPRDVDILFLLPAAEYERWWNQAREQNGWPWPMCGLGSKAETPRVVDLRAY